MGGAQQVRLVRARLGDGVFEDELREIHDSANDDLPGLRRRLEAVQERFDVASLNSEEWNVLYRLRLQAEQSAERKAHPG